MNVNCEFRLTALAFLLQHAYQSRCLSGNPCQPLSTVSFEQNGKGIQISNNLTPLPYNKED